MRFLLLLSIFLISLNLFAAKAYAGDQEIELVFSLMRQKKWDESQKLANKKGITALKKIVLAQKFLDSNNKSGFEEMINFLSNNPNWPGANSIKANAEHNINCNTDKKKIFDWFNKNKPITPSGHKFYAYAAVEFMPNNDKRLANIIKNGWIYGNFSQGEQKAYYNRFNSYLTTGDHIRKVDNNLLSGRVSAAREALSFVPKSYIASFNAQLAFINNKHDAIGLFKKIPKQYRTPGLIYQYLSKIKSGPSSCNEVMLLIEQVRHHPEHGNRFWNLQSYIAREYIEQKKYVDAYKIASIHFAVGAEEYSNAEFLSGWLALRFLHKPNLALKHFENFDKAVKSPISKSRGEYWLARTYAAQGKREESARLFNKTAVKYPYTFYGQLAAYEAGLKRLPLSEGVNIAEHKNERLVKENDLLHAAKLVSAYGSNGMAEFYLTASVSGLSDQRQILALAGSIAEHRNIHHTVWLAKNAMQKHLFIRGFAYPTPYNVDGLMTEAPLTYSIIRQESVFDQYAVSAKKAMGLMQVIEETACLAAKNMKITCKVSGLRNDPNYNMRIGSYYLNKMIERYNGSYILAIAAYNAGPHRVDKWLKIYGDPRKVKDFHKIIDWIEEIPFYETRNYVHRVLEGLQIYRVIINKNNYLRIDEDLINKRRI